MESINFKKKWKK